MIKMVIHFDDIHISNSCRDFIYSSLRNPSPLWRKRLRVGERLTPHNDEVLQLCDTISQSLYRLQDILEQTK